MTLRALALVVVALAVGAEAAQGAPELPLGPRALDEHRSSARLAPSVRWTRIVREGGPWRVNVLSIAPGARVVVVPAGAAGVRARPSTLSRRLAAVAAVNGGYFAADGNPAGVLASAGALLSEPVGGRSALALGARRRVTALRFGGAKSKPSPRVLRMRSAASDAASSFSFVRRPIWVSFACACLALFFL